MMQQEASRKEPVPSSPFGLLGAGGLLVLLVFMIVLLVHLRFGIWVILASLLPLVVQTLIFAGHFTEGKDHDRLSGWSYAPSVLAIGFFLFLTISGVARMPGAAVTSSSTGADQAEEVPFEMLHGYGPITEIVEVGPIDTAMALRGQPIFETKCGTCHKLDERYTGPPLRYVTNYRSPTFIMNQILDPAQNVAKHPHMQEMLKMYYTYMTNQNVSVEDARILVEYLRWEATRSGQ